MIAESRKRRLRVHERAILTMKIWVAYVAIRVRLHRKPLPNLVDQLVRARVRRGASRHPARWLGFAVRRALSLVARDPTCLTSSLVLMSLLRAQGDPAVLVIGLPPAPVDERAHAWVELHGIDIGPPPGRGHYIEFARYGG